MWDLFVRVVCVWERESVCVFVWRLKALKTKVFLRVVRDLASREVMHVPCIWLECEESRQMETAVFWECLAGKAFLRDTRETFYFVHLSYLIYPVSTHIIYTHITHICWGVLFREKTLATTFES